MSGFRWSTFLAVLEAKGGPIGPHPDPETARLLAENPPADRPPVPEPKYDTRETERRLDVDEQPAEACQSQVYNLQNPDEREAFRVALYAGLGASVTDDPDAGPPYTHVHNPAPTDEDGNERPPHPGYTFRTVNQERAELGIPPLGENEPVLLPNPPTRRGWRRFFRRAA